MLDKQAVIILYNLKITKTDIKYYNIWQLLYSIEFDYNYIFYNWSVWYCFIVLKLQKCANALSRLFLMHSHVFYFIIPIRENYSYKGETTKFDSAI